MKHTTRKRIIAVSVVAVMAVSAIAYVRIQRTAGVEQIATVAYSCNGSKAITAAYYQGESKSPAGPDMPPTPGGHVELVLGDGRRMTLPQTISADGIRYANADESFVFWSKGNGALVLEDGEEKSYIGCIEVAKDPGDLPQIYADSSHGFSLRYPAGYAMDDTYVYRAFGPGKDISGVKFTIAPSIAKGTNLGRDSYVSVEQISHVRDCSAALFLDDPQVAVQDVADGGMTYSVASSTGAGAGNRYEETVYVITGTEPCVAVRYFIHYSAIENFPEGTVQPFSHAALVAAFDQIRKTLVLDR